jgi:syntaxin 18
MRFQDAINRRMPRKKIQKRPEIKPAESSKSNLVLQSDVSKIVEQEVSTAPMRVQEQLLDDETKALQVVCGWHINHSLVKKTWLFYLTTMQHVCPETLLRWS